MVVAFQRVHRLRQAVNQYRSILGRSLLTLAIETSCDDTSVALLESNEGRAPALQGDNEKPNAQLHFHKTVTSDSTSYHGIQPVIALHSHQQNLARLVKEAISSLANSNVHEHGVDQAKVGEVDGSALRRRPDFLSVTRGPGMRSNLSTGLDTAKGLAVAWQVPLVGINHMQAHALTPRLVNALEQRQGHPLKPSFPFLTLLVSGGHTMLVNSKSLTDHAILASTSDIAIGDALDKAGRHILPADILAASTTTMYGRLLEKFAFPNGVADHDYIAPPTRTVQRERKETSWGWKLSTPLAASRAGAKVNAMEYTFSGTCSLVKRIMEHSPHPVSPEERKDLAREVMTVAFEHLASRIDLGLEQLSKSVAAPNTLVVSGGVAANKFLRTVLRACLDARGYSQMELIFPPLELCTDNAAMIGWAGLEMFRAGWHSDLSIQPLRKWYLDPAAADGGILGVPGWRNCGQSTDALSLDEMHLVKD